MSDLKILKEFIANRNEARLIDKRQKVDFAEFKKTITQYFNKIKDVKGHKVKGANAENFGTKKSGETEFNVILFFHEDVPSYPNSKEFYDELKKIADKAQRDLIKKYPTIQRVRVTSLNNKAVDITFHFGSLQTT